ncbi:MAG: hypothetical protein DRJ68_00405 [Thermoprotei archaeon]|nr:MAG: hypothetical protein DRJ68_00405 [Thermoprotei archaeon]
MWSSNYEYNRVMAGLIELCFSDGLLTVKDIASSLGVSLSYAYFLLKRLRRDLNFTIRAKPYYEKLGLRFAPCFMSVSSLSTKKALLEVFASLEYTLYAAPCDGHVRGLYFDFVVPMGCEGELLALLEFCSSSGLIDNYSLYFTSSPNNVVMGFEWYDFASHQWVYRWQELVDDVVKRADDSGFEFRALALGYEQAGTAKIDWLDLLILHHLELDIFTSLKSMASVAGVTPQDMGYHFKNHVVKRGLVKVVRPYWVHVPLQNLCMGVIDLRFSKLSCLEGFIKALNRKPIAYSYTYYQVDSSPSILLGCAMPFKEFSMFMSCLDELRSLGLLKEFRELFLDIENSRGRALPYELFREGRWIYDIESCFSKLASMAEAQRVEAKFARAAERAMESK